MGDAVLFATLASSAYSTIRLAYTFKKGMLKGLTIRAGCTNLFDKMPPPAPAVWTDSNADIGTYGCLGRVLYIDASYKFGSASR